LLKVKNKEKIRGIGYDKHRKDILTIDKYFPNHCIADVSIRLRGFCKEMSHLLVWECLPLIQRAASEDAAKDKEKVDDVRLLEKELRDCQREVIELQKKIIQLQDEDLSAAKAVSETVKSEMKSFSAVISNNCAAAVSPTRLQAVIKKTITPASDIVDRSCNLMIFNLEEEKGEDSPVTAAEDRKAVEQILDELNEKFQLSNLKRVGTKSEKNTRPMIATLSSRENLLTLLRKAKELKKTDNFHSVYLGPDRTFDERAERSKALESLKRLRNENPNKQYVLRRGVIECV
jgi:hypothetical protein